MKRSNNEHVQQSALIQWRDINKSLIPELQLLFAIPNAGGYTGGFKSNMLRVIKMKAEGLTPGVPDLFLAVPMMNFHGLFIEMKYGKNKPSPEQDKMICKLVCAGYAVSVCYSWVEAKEKIEWYLGLSQNVT